MNNSSTLSQSRKYSKMKSVSEWAASTHLPEELWKTLESYLLESAGYIQSPYVKRINADGTECMVFKPQTLAFVWTALTGPGDVGELERGIEALRLYESLATHPEFMTLEQFLKAAATPQIDARREELEMEIAEAFEAVDGGLGDPPEYTEYDVRSGEVRELPMLPRTLLVPLLHGGLPL